MTTKNETTKTAAPPKKPWFLNRGMKWLYSLALLAGLTYAGLYQFGLYLLANPQYGSMNVIGHNYTDRPIFTFSIGDAGGGNVEVTDGKGWGGGMTCCLTLERGQKEVKVEWEVSHSLAQTLAINPKFKLGQDKPLPRDHREKTVPIPPNLDLMTSYVGVHFLKNGNVKLNFTSNTTPDPLPENEREE